MGFKFKFKPKPKKARSSRMKSLTADQVEQMFDLYCKEFTAPAIAETVGVSVNVVRGLINDGRGDLYEPLKVRRARIVAAAVSMQDTKQIQRLAAFQSFGSEFLSATGRRMLERISASRQLDNPELYADEENLERSLLERIAYEPNTADVQTAMNMNTKLLELGMRISDQPDAPAVQVNINQNQSQDAKAVSSTSARALDEAYAFMSRAGKNIAGTDVVTALVKETSLAIEKEEYAIEEKRVNAPDGLVVCDSEFEHEDADGYIDDTEYVGDSDDA